MLTQTCPTQFSSEFLLILPSFLPLFVTSRNPILANLPCGWFVITTSDGPDKGLSLLNPLKESGWRKMKDKISPKKIWFFPHFYWFVCMSFDIPFIGLVHDFSCEIIWPEEQQRSYENFHISWYRVFLLVSNCLIMVSY